MNMSIGEVLEMIDVSINLHRTVAENEHSNNPGSHIIDERVGAVAALMLLRNQISYKAAIKVETYN